MTWQGVLVSVRDAEEAEEALAGGADVIDVKDPVRGSLGAAEPTVVAAVARVMGRRVPWTMAAGELAMGAVAIGAWLEAIGSAMPPGAAGPAAVKVGLAGMARRPWRDELLQVHTLLPAGCMHVAVAYADFDRVDAPSPPDVIAAAGRLGCGMLLIDTADKRGPGLLGLRSPQVIDGWVADARRHGLGVALAGRVAIEEIRLAVTCGPDLVALRSAVCSNAAGGDVRLGRVSSNLVATSVTEFEAAPRRPLEHHSL